MVLLLFFPLSFNLVVAGVGIEVKITGYLLLHCLLSYLMSFTLLLLKFLYIFFLMYTDTKEVIYPFGFWRRDVRILLPRPLLRLRSRFILFFFVFFCLDGS